MTVSFDSIAQQMMDTHANDLRFFYQNIASEDPVIDELVDMSAAKTDAALDELISQLDAETLGRLIGGTSYPTNIFMTPFGEVVDHMSSTSETSGMTFLRTTATAIVNGIIRTHFQPISAS